MSKDTEIESNNPIHTANEEPAGKYPTRGGKASDLMDEAMGLPPIKHLIYPFIAEGFVTILFSEAGAGKTALGYQFAEIVASGKPIGDFKTETGGVPVLYFDFELSLEQILDRYTKEGISYEWHDNFHLEIQNEYYDGLTDSGTILDRAKILIGDIGARLLIVDNITAMNPELEKSSNSIELIQKLKQFARLQRVALLIVAHPPKRDPSQPIYLSDLAGSVKLNQLSDSIFTIGKSLRHGNMRYIKQLKHRKGVTKYDGTDGVLSCSISQRMDGLVFFSAGDTERESRFLVTPEQAERYQKKSDAVQMVKDGKSLRVVAEDLGVSHEAVRKWIKQSENGE